MSATTKITFSSIIAGIIIIFMTFFFIKPTISQVSNLNTVFAEKKQELATTEQQIRAFRTVQSDLNQAVERGLLAEAIVEKTDLVEPIINVEKAASQSALIQTLDIIDDVKSQYKPILKDSADLEEIPYLLSTESDFFGFVNYLKYLEHLPQFTEVSKMNLTAEIIQAKDKPPTRTGKIFGNIEGAFFVKITQ